MKAFINIILFILIIITAVVDSNRLSPMFISSTLGYHRMPFRLKEGKIEKTNRKADIINSKKEEEQTPNVISNSNLKK